MNPLIQLNRQLQHLFIALLLACVAIAQSARAVTPEPDGGDAKASTAEEDNAIPEFSTDTGNAAMGQLTSKEVGRNRWVIQINITKALPQCAAGNVSLQGDLVVTFEDVKDVGVVPKSAKLEAFRGTAVAPPPSGRKLEVNPNHLKLRVNFERPKEGKEGEFFIKFLVTGPGLPAGPPLHILVNTREIIYKFRDGKVTELVLPNDIGPTVKCCGPGSPESCVGR